MPETIIDTRTPNFGLACPGPNHLDVDVLRIIEALHAVDALIKALGEDVASRALSTTLATALAGIKPMPAGDLVGTTDAQRLTGKVLDTKTATLASASTVDVGPAMANRITVTGATTIISLGAATAGVSRTLTFAGTPTLSHSANLILPGQANIVAAAGDVAEFESVTPGTWRCTGYMRASGLALAGVPLQVSRVAGTTVAAAIGNDYVLENAAATAVTAPATTAEGAEFAVTPANGLMNNSVDFGAATVQGAAGALTGVVTLDRGTRMRFRYSSTLSKWVAS